MAQRNSSTKYDGPSAREMIDTHTLAKEVIARHNEACPIFDDYCILELRRFVQDPDSAQDFLRERDMIDEDGAKLGSAASAKGSLTGFIMATYGTDESALTEEEVLELREWFDNGGGLTDEEVKAKKV